MDVEEPEGLYVLIGRNMTECRVAEGLTRSEIAAWAQEFGLPWTERITAETERGARRVPLDEWATIPLVYAASPERLLAGDGIVRLNGQASAQLEGLRAVLCGPFQDVRPFDHFDTPISRRMLADAASRSPDMTVDDIPDNREYRSPDSADTATARQTERNAAAGLGITTEAPGQAPFDLWGQSLVEERDQRVTELGADPAEAREPRAVRGHITRRLLRELKSHLQKVPT